LQDRDLLLYYRLEKDGPMTLRVLNANGKMVGLLSQGVHSGGINSFAWDGQGLNGEKASAGWYTLEVGTDRSTRRLRVKVVR
jgi:flagellar hook assembly protein FlgD